MHQATDVTDGKWASEEREALSQIADEGTRCAAGFITRTQNLAIFLAGLAHVGRRYPTLRRWFLGNRLRQLSVGLAYTASKNGFSTPPRSISFRPTFLCNAHCAMCQYANSFDPDIGGTLTSQTQVIDIEVAYRLVDAIAPSHTMLNITGGEPFLWGENLFALLDYCRERRVAVSITTNGTFVGRYLDRLLESSPDVLAVSLLGPEQIHNEIVGLPAYPMIREALVELHARKGGDRWERSLVMTNTAMVPGNGHAFSEVVRLSHSMGACAANFQPMWFATEEMHDAYEGEPLASNHSLSNASYSINPERIDAVQVWKSMQRARVLAAQLGQAIHFYPRLSQADTAVYYHHPRQPIGRSRALCAHLLCQVLPDGSVSPCEGHTVGNLYEEDFLQIWNGPAMREFRQRLKAAGIFPICTRCCSLWRNE